MTDRFDRTRILVNLAKHLVHPIHGLGMIDGPDTAPFFFPTSNKHQFGFVCADPFNQTG